MKTLLIGFVVAVGLLAWRSEDIANMLGGAIASKPAQPLSLNSLVQAPVTASAQ